MTLSQSAVSIPIAPLPPSTTLRNDALKGQRVRECEQGGTVPAGTLVGAGSRHDLPDTRQTRRRERQLEPQREHPRVPEKTNTAWKADTAGELKNEPVRLTSVLTNELRSPVRRPTPEQRLRSCGKLPDERFGFPDLRHLTDALAGVECHRLDRPADLAARRPGGEAG